MTKKLIALIFVFAFTNTFFAQEAKIKSSKTKVKTEQVVTKAKADVKLKKDGTPDKRYNGVKANADVKLKKDGTPDKRYNDAKTEVKTTKTQIKKTAAEEKEDMKETALSKVAEKKVKDKSSGSYKGKKVFTGPKGGKYYINKNGNKTYIDRDSK